MMFVIAVACWGLCLVCREGVSPRCLLPPLCVGGWVWLVREDFPHYVLLPLLFVQVWV